MVYLYVRNDDTKIVIFIDWKVNRELIKWLM